MYNKALDNISHTRHKWIQLTKETGLSVASK